MSRHTTFRYCLDPSVEQYEVLARHAGASRFAFNQCLRLVKSALTGRKTDAGVEVPWTGFDLINAFNAWKKTEDAGRVFAVDAHGNPEVLVTGLPWRREVCQQVFEEAAVDLGKGLNSWSDSRTGKRKGKRVGFPRFKKKTADIPSFRLRNKHPKGKPPAIRVGDNNRPRSITLPGIGLIKVHDDTRRLRRMLAKHRVKILFATISHHGGRWRLALNVEAADLHPNHQHPTCPDEGGGWVGGCGPRPVGVSGRGHRRRHRGLPDQRCAQSVGRWDETPATVVEVVVTQEEGITPPQGCRGQARAASSSCRQCAPALPASGVGRVGQDPRPARHRELERGGDAGQSPPGSGDLRCRLVTVRPSADLQAGVARRAARRSRPLVSVDPPVPPMRDNQQ